MGEIIHISELVKKRNQRLMAQNLREMPSTSPSFRINASGEITEAPRILQETAQISYVGRERFILKIIKDTLGLLIKAYKRYPRFTI